MNFEKNLFDFQNRKKIFDFYWTQASMNCLRRTKISIEFLLGNRSQVSKKSK